MASSSARRLALLAHRYVGLAIAVFLLVAGLTGSMMAFYVQLDRLLNPELFCVEPPAPGAPLLDPFVVRDALLRQVPEARSIHGVVLSLAPDSSVNYWLDGSELFVDPYTGKLLGRRRFGDLFDGRKSLLTFFYELHFTLGLHDVGSWLMGIVALLWTVDCFVGAYVTFPQPLRSQERASSKGWLRRWLPAWLIKGHKLFALIFTWHRASGLWLWGVLLVFAWSAVALNLRPVYSPVMGALFGEERDPFEQLPELKLAVEQAPIPLRDALPLARRLMAGEAKRRGFDLYGERYLDYLPEHGVFAYTVESSLDVSERLAETTLAFDAEGETRVFHARTGQQLGTSITSWLIALHFGAVREGGIGYRVFVCLLGAVVALLALSGVLIWWRKRPKRAPPRGPGFQRMAQSENDRNSSAAASPKRSR